MTAKAMLLQPAVTVDKPAEFGLLMRALTECLQAATAALAEALSVDVATPEVTEPRRGRSRA